MLRFLRKKNKKKGFTLTELIVVVAILGVLAAITTPAVLGYIEDAKKNTDETNRMTIENSAKRLIAKGAIAQSDLTNIKAQITKEMGTMPEVTQDKTKKFVLTLDSSGNPIVMLKTSAGVSEVLLN